MPAGTVFKHWNGDTAWLKDSASAKTTVTVPFKNIQMEAVFGTPQ